MLKKVVEPIPAKNFSSSSMTRNHHFRSRALYTRWVVLTLLACAYTVQANPIMAQQPGKLNTPIKPPLLAQRRAETAYTLGPGDRIRLDVFNVPEYSGEFQVLVDGTINLPIIGSLPVEGLTLEGASDNISNQYARFLKRPLVTVSLLAPRPLKIGVSGEVSRPGSYTVSLAESRQFPTVTQAIQLAGGTTQAANIRSVEILRRGQEKPIYVNLVDVLQKGDLSQDITLRDGDTVFLPTAVYTNGTDGSIIASSTLAAQTAGSKVAVVGEVSRPGTYLLKAEPTGPNSTVRPPTLTQAILLAGGFTPSANTRQIQVRRLTRNGPPQVFNVNLLQLLQSGDVAQDILLQEGDTVLIPTRTDVNAAESRTIASSTLATQTSGPIKVDLVGEVFRPGTYAIKPQAAGANGGGSPPTLTDAIQTAGGIKPTADIRTIRVRRFTRTGNEQVIDVNLWQLLQGDVAQDLSLQEGDIISVPVAKQMDPKEAEALAMASFAPNEMVVNIVGEVTRPGPVKVPPNTPLNQALLAAGGFNIRARKTVVSLVRLNPDGTVTERNVNVDFSQGIGSETNPVLHNNDTIVVRRSGLTAVTDTLGTILSPVGAFFSIFNFFR